MSAHKTTKNQLISQLFWQMEIGADEAISAYPSVHDDMTSLKQYMALLKTPVQLDLSQPKVFHQSQLVLFSKIRGQAPAFWNKIAGFLTLLSALR